ncbi:MAG: hypothetical protein H6581_16935 [Bacteroidia bacterium]|nr:hypothetical protein [Bacteroidia bacterium]
MARYEILKIYKGDFILSLGRPHLLLVGVENNDELFLEKFLWMEDLTGKHVHEGEKSRSVRMQGVFDNIEEFMTYQGLEETENKLYLQTIQEQEKNKNATEKPAKVPLKETTKTAFLLHMKVKAPKELDWIAQHTESQNLKYDISRYQELEIKSEPFK